MLSFRVFVRPNSRRPAPQTTSLRNLRVLRVSALDSSSLHFPLSQVKSSTPCTKLVQYKPIGINTCKSGSKQTTLSTFRINTYEKHRGGCRRFCPFSSRVTVHGLLRCSLSLQVCTFVFNHFHDAPPATLFLSNFCIIARGCTPLSSSARVPYVHSSKFHML